MAQARLALVALTLSAAGLVGIALHEGYTDRAIIPVPGDVPTSGFGTTGGVKLGDKTTPPEALQRLLKDINTYEGAIKSCVFVPLTQNEYDAYTSFAYNLGGGTFCKYIAPRLNQGNYAEACAALDLFICGPADAATRAKPGQQCYDKDHPMRVYQGLINRRAEERAKCESKG